MSKLYIIPTPIGNLKDITLRSIELLNQVDLILAEDTRVSKKVLNHFKINTKLISYHQFNEHKELDKIIGKLKLGNNLALISDAGTPSISDPGFLLVRECLKNKISVETLPGPTALIPALVNSGLASERFVFEGFLPVKKGRLTRLKKLLDEERTMIFYESPHRIIKTLTSFIEFFGTERRVSVSREITKLYEETQRGSLKEILEYFTQKKIKGEFVIVLEGKND
jgi:16S rRNA (cytidine1402-2'-O)-methyltransferase